MSKNIMYYTRFITYASLFFSTLFVILCGRIILITLCFIGAIVSGFLLGIIGAVYGMLKVARQQKNRWRGIHEWF